MTGNIPVSPDERRRSTRIRIGVTAALVVVAVAIGTLFLTTRGGSEEVFAVPTAVTDSGAIRVEGGTPEAPAASPVVLTVFEDFQCPVCQQFESAFGPTIDRLRTELGVTVDYHPIAILDRMSSTQYSTRAANASLCVAEESDQTWLDFHRTLYDVQPPEGGEGLSNDRLTEIATTVGAPESVTQCITDGRFESWVGQSTDQVLERNVTATPTVLLDGEVYQPTTPQALFDAVTTAMS